MGAKQAPYFFCRITGEAVRIFRAHAALLVAWLRGGGGDLPPHAPPPTDGLPSHAPPPAALLELLAAGHSRASLAGALDASYVDCYVDDFVQVGPPNGVTVLNGILEETGARLGLEYKLSKDVKGDAVEVLGALLSAPGPGGHELGAGLRVSDAKASRYTEAVVPVLEAATQGLPVTGAAYDRMVGKLMYVACLSRFGRAESRPFYTQRNANGVGTKRERRKRMVGTSAGLADSLLAWVHALSAPRAGGMTGRTRWTALSDDDAARFPHHLQRQDASGWGWGGRAGPRGTTDPALSLEVVRPWTAAERALSITLRELLAAVVLFELAAPGRANGLVFIETDNTGARSIINNGGSSVPEANDMVRRVAATCALYNIEVRARHVPGVEMIHDGIDGLSRPGKGAPPVLPYNRAVWEAGRGPRTRALLEEDEARERTEEDYKLIEFDMFNVYHVHDVDACCDAKGLNAQRGCAHPFHSGRPVQRHWRELVGRTAWVNPPFSQAEEVLEALVRAYMQAPLTTRATVVLPVWETARWYQRYVAAGILRHAHTFDAGSRIFSQPARRGAPSTHRFNSGATEWDVGVYRLGAWAGDPLLA